MQAPLDLFWQRLPKFAYAMDFLGPMALLPKAQAVLLRYIQTQPKNVIGALPFDIDCKFGALTWDDANLPPPNLVVINPKNTHAHYLYLIQDPIFLGEGKPLTQAAQYLRTVHRGMTFQLKADPSYSGFTVKNPLHEHWPVWSPRTEPYELNELLDWITPEALKFARQRPKPSEEFGLGRNVALFNSTRLWAYKWVLTYKETASYKEWTQLVLVHAQELNAQFKYPLERPEVEHTAKSIARWTWENFSKAGLAKVQSTRGKKSGKVRGEATATQLTEIAQEIRKAGERPSTARIAEASKLSERQVRRHSAGIKAGLAAKNGPSPIYPDMVNVRSMHNSYSERVSAVIEMRSKGMTQQQIAAELGINQATVSRILRKTQE